jgi:hypothetical protein
MKKIVIAILIAAACVGVSTPNAHAIGLYGIWWMPDKSDDDGWGGGIKDTKHFTPLLALDGRVSYVSFPDAGIIPLEMTGMVSLGVWYGGFGVGYYFMTGDAELKDTFGYYFLAGLELGLGGTSVFGEIKWQSLQPEIDLPSGGDVNFDALAIHVGATLGLR